VSSALTWLGEAFGGAESDVGLAGATSTTPWSSLDAGFQQWLTASSEGEAKWGTLSPTDQQDLANAYWIQESAGGNAGNLINLATGAQDLTGVGSAATSPGNVAESPFGAVGDVVSGAISNTVGFVFQTIGSFLVNFVTGAISAVRSSTGTHLLGLVVGLVVVVVMFR
jgi:hypothetical protein